VGAGLPQGKPSPPPCCCASGLGPKWFPAGNKAGTRWLESPMCGSRHLFAHVYEWDPKGGPLIAADARAANFAP